MRNLKRLLLGAAVIAAVSVAGPVSASAAAEFHYGAFSSSILTGNNEGFSTISFNGPVVECESSQSKGTAFGLSNSEMSLHPTYSSCTSSLGVSPVDTSGCNFNLTSTTNIFGYMSSSISCTGTSTIKITMPGCTVSVGSQNVSGGVVVTNLGSGSSRKMKITTELAASYTKSGFGCFVVSSVSATFRGWVVLADFVDNGVVGNIDEGATYTEGAEAGIWWE